MEFPSHLFHNKGPSGFFLTPEISPPRTPDTDCTPGRGEFGTYV